MSTFPKRRFLTMIDKKRMMMTMMMRMTMATMKAVTKKVEILQIDEMMRWADKDGDGLVSN